MLIDRSIATALLQRTFVSLDQLNLMIARGMGPSYSDLIEVNDHPYLHMHVRSNEIHFDPMIDCDAFDKNIDERMLYISPSAMDALHILLKSIEDEESGFIGVNTLMENKISNPIKADKFSHEEVYACSMMQIYTLLIAALWGPDLKDENGDPSTIMIGYVDDDMYYVGDLFDIIDNKYLVKIPIKDVEKLGFAEILNMILSSDIGDNTTFSMGCYYKDYSIEIDVKPISGYDMTHGIEIMFKIPGEDQAANRILIDVPFYSITELYLPIASLK